MTDNWIFVGYGKKDITPLGAIPLSGYGNDASRISEGVLDHLWGICLAISDRQGNTVLLYSLDLLLMDRQITRRLRHAVREQTGITDDRILFAATHSHSAPSLNPLLPGVESYLQMLTQQVVAAAQEALADRVAATVLLGSTEADSLNYTRHYVNGDGTCFGDNFGVRSDVIAGHVGKPDRQIQLVRFQREGKRDVLLLNWQAHGKMCSTATSEFGKDHNKLLSADFIGYARQEMEERTGASVVYFSGASGNLNPDSRIFEEAPPKEPDKFGQLFAESACAALENMKSASGGELTCRWLNVTVPIDHSDDDIIETAREVWSLWGIDAAKSKELALDKGFHSAYAARDVIRRYDSGECAEIEMGIVTAGDLAFVAVPYEMFCDNGQCIKEKSPYQTTLILTCVNEYHKYLPSVFAFEHGCYEVDSRIYPKGTAELLVDAILDSLNCGYLASSEKLSTNDNYVEY